MLKKNQVIAAFAKASPCADPQFDPRFDRELDGRRIVVTSSVVLVFKKYGDQGLAPGGEIGDYLFLCFNNTLAVCADGDWQQGFPADDGSDSALDISNIATKLRDGVAASVWPAPCLLEAASADTGIQSDEIVIEDGDVETARPARRFVEVPMGS